MLREGSILFVFFASEIIAGEHKKLDHEGLKTKNTLRVARSTFWNRHPTTYGINYFFLIFFLMRISFAYIFLEEIGCVASAIRGKRRYVGNFKWPHNWPEAPLSFIDTTRHNLLGAHVLGRLSK